MINGARDEDRLHEREGTVLTSWALSRVEKILVICEG